VPGWPAEPPLPPEEDPPDAEPPVPLPLPPVPGRPLPPGPLEQALRTVADRKIIHTPRTTKFVTLLIAPEDRDVERK